MNDPTLTPHIIDDVRRALAEDLGTGDVTAALIPENHIATAALMTREDAVLCGSDWFNAVLQSLDENINIAWLARDGDLVSANQTLCRVHGPARALLSGERCAMNFVQLLSGTASMTRRYVAAIAGTGAQILDTRKTLPGLRIAQKYAVRCGGGGNHRFGLYDAILIKENHIAACGSIERAICAARQRYPSLPVEIEVENGDELQQALQAGAQRVLLDNFALDDLGAAVAATAGRAQLEASGGVSLDNVRAIADTGVDFISVGALTKHVHAIDLSLRIVY